MIMGILCVALPTTTLGKFLPCPRFFRFLLAALSRDDTGAKSLLSRSATLKCAHAAPATQGPGTERVVATLVRKLAGAHGAAGSSDSVSDPGDVPAREKVI